jgi:hypothetical protein
MSLIQLVMVAFPRIDQEESWLLGMLNSCLSPLLPLVFVDLTGTCKFGQTLRWKIFQVQFICAFNQ